MSPVSAADYKATPGWPTREITPTFDLFTIQDINGTEPIVVLAGAGAIVYPAIIGGGGVPGSLLFSTVSKRIMDYAIQITGGNVNDGISLFIEPDPYGDGLGVYGFEDALALVNSQGGLNGHVNTLIGYELPPMAVGLTLWNDTANDLTVKGTIILRSL